MAILLSGPGLVVCGPAKVGVVFERSEGERWCFVERKRTEFFWRVFRDVGTAPEDDWYGPWAHMECGSCGCVDADVGFGRVRMYGEDE